MDNLGQPTTKLPNHPFQSESTTTTSSQYNTPRTSLKSAGTSPLPQHQTRTPLLNRYHFLYTRQLRHNLVTGIVLLGLITLFFAATSASTIVPSEQTSSHTKSFYIINRPIIIFTHSIGTVHITRGAEGQVTIKERRNGFTDAIHTHYTQEADALTVTADIPDDIPSDTWVDFDVSTPDQVGLSVLLPNGGTLEADGLSGQITLSNTNGSISAANLNGDITLKTASGSIMTNHISGQITLATQNGTIMTMNTTIRGYTTVEAETGTINFHGTLDHNGKVLFKDSNGDIGITLPQNTHFHTEARSITGPITTNFPGITVAHQATDNVARGNSGTPPLAQLAIQTTSGSITIQQAK